MIEWRTFGRAFRSLPVALLLSCFAVSVLASDRSSPSSAGIERLVRDALAKDEVELPSLLPLRNATLLDFRLVGLQQASQTRWLAMIDMLFDFGEPSPFVIGFQRVRHGRYRLVLQQQNGQLELTRFTPVARIHPLPVERSWLGGGRIREPDPTPSRLTSP